MREMKKNKVLSEVDDTTIYTWVDLWELLKSEMFILLF